MSTDLSRFCTRIVGLLVLVEAVSVYFLWALNPVGKPEQGIFAILLAIDLVALAMISYIYRTYKHGEQFNRALLIGGCCLILIFVYVSLAITGS